MQGRRKWEIPEKTRRPTASCGTIPTRENPRKAASFAEIKAYILCSMSINSGNLGIPTLPPVGGGYKRPDIPISRRPLGPLLRWQKTPFIELRGPISSALVKFPAPFTVQWRGILLCLQQGVYPIQKAVVYDPEEFDVLYHSSKGAFLETWIFAKTVRVTAFILASQQVNLCGGGEGYRENVTLKISKVEGARSTPQAEAQFEGEVAYGKEIRVSLLNLTTGAYPQFFYGGSNFHYSVRVEFGGQPGVYPWHATRNFASACATTNTNTPGHIIGIEFTCSFQDKIDVKYIYSEVTFAIGSQFIRATLHASEPIADLQGNTLRIPSLPGVGQQPMNTQLRLQDAED
ncbi:hypothetical protein PR048_027493 [Dryococelus australis]|uniref:Uncharacterized protein n=1 Tax=Dryococelus australis TaxID=614101 RepID=A0ABQ9GFT9_9NEOP|nr:hypothetical protein PR048_027493 [Dryococelus australis]